MKPEKAQNILNNLNDPSGPLHKRKLQERTMLSEVATDGSKHFHVQGEPSHDTGTTPGEFVVVRTENVGAAHHLGAIAKAGYLVTEKPQQIEPGNTDPQLELISHSNGDMGTLSETIFRDHNPHN